MALQIDFGMQILTAVSGKSPAEIYSKIDVHMTDSVSHNKGVADVLQDLYDLDTKAGQIFCSTHTTMGFSNSMNKDVANIEGDMKVEQILQKFMVAMKLDSKHGSLAGQVLDMCLSGGTRVSTQALELLQKVCQLFATEECSSDSVLLQR